MKCFNCEWSRWDGGNVLFCPFVLGTCINGAEPVLEHQEEQKPVQGSTEPPQRMRDTERDYNKLFTYDGEAHTLKEWARLRGVKLCTIRSRVSKGWSFADALERGMDESIKYNR